MGMCKKQMTIHEDLLKYTIDKLDETDIHLEVDYSIEDCPKYSPLARSERDEDDS
jgi:hypothetical protein